MQTTTTHTVTLTNSARQREVRRKLLNGERPTYATVLLALLSDHFGTIEWFGWSPDVLGQEVIDDFGVEMPPDVRDQIWAMVSCLTTDRFYNDPLFFNHVANALSGEPLSMQVYEPADVDEMAWALLEVGLNDLEDGEEPKFDPQVEEYLRQALRRQGYRNFGPFDFLGDSPVDMPFADDLEMAGAYFQEAEQDEQEIMDVLQHRVQDLHQQLKELEIRRD